MPAREPITVTINEKLVDVAQRLAEDCVRSTRGYSKEFYVEYYLHLQPHFTFLFDVGTGLGIQKNDKVLEVGSGLGTRCLLGNAIWHAEFTGLEPAINTYSALREGIQEFQSTNPKISYTSHCRFGEDTGLRSNSFDFVLSFEVMEHVQDPRQVIMEMHRVLKPGGKLFLSTINYRSFFEGHFGCLWLPFLGKRSARFWVDLLGRNPEFINEINFISRSQLLKYLQSAGFKNVRLGYKYPEGSPPELRVTMPPGFDPRIENRRPPFMQTFIQRSPIQRVLSVVGMEYKIYVEAQKP